MVEQRKLASTLLLDSYCQYKHTKMQTAELQVHLSHHFYNLNALWSYLNNNNKLKKNDLILNLTPENVTQHSRIE